MQELVPLLSGFAAGVVLGALRDPSFALIFLGFFSCGYQLAFITAHFPAFVAEVCGPIMLGSVLHAMGITTTGALGAVRAGFARWSADRKQRAADRKLWDIALSDARVMADLSRAMGREAADLGRYRYY